MSNVETRLFVLSLIVCGLVFGTTGVVFGQSVNSGTVEGTVVDETGAVIVGAKVEIKNPISGYDQVQQTDATGKFRFTNIPFNNYHLEATLPGFTTAQQDVNVRTVVTVSARLTLTVGNVSQTVNVEATGDDLVETAPYAHVDVDLSTMQKLPFQHIGILSLEFHVDKLSRPLL